MKIKKLTVAAAIALGVATCTFSSAMADCGCNKTAPEEVTGGACPCQMEQQVDPCEPCEAKESKCDLPAQPTCASCNQPATATRQEMHQAYAYPNAVYGTNNYVGELGNGITLTEGSVLSNNALDKTAGTTINNTSMTGAACDIPVIGDTCLKQEKKQNCGCPIDINTENSMDVMKKSYLPFEINSKTSGLTGAAADLVKMFPDVSDNYWAACDINKLARNDVVVGYPDGMFKPSRNVSRAEFATMIVKGMNMNTCGLPTKCLFSDVPAGNWANPLIAKAVDEDLMSGYPNGTFKPHNSVTRAEALVALSKASKDCNMDKCKADEILSKYSDANTIPEWAQIPIAQAIQMGALENSPNQSKINPDKKASRAEVASMLQPVRVAAGYDKNPQTANASCPLDDNRQAYVEDSEMIQVPTLKMEFRDQVNAKNANVGQHFTAKSLESITINGTTFPAGSYVSGKVIEVIRPSGSQKGALKLAFTEIQNGDCKAELPQQILTAQITKQNTPNPVSRLITMPFTWTGSLVGIAGRTVGGAIANLGNAVENVTGGVGTAFGETLQAQLPAAGRSLADSVVETVKAPIDITRTAVSGTMGLFQSTGDEFAYLVDPNGYKISSVNPKEHITVAFGCEE